MFYVRLEAAHPNLHGRCPGIFALANGLASSGELSAQDWAWWRASNDWFDAAYPDPAMTDPSLFNRSIHPDATCWFKSTAHHLLDRIPAYLELLDRYDVAWARRTSADPGSTIYEDDVQIVVDGY